METKRILIVDDEPDLCDIVAFNLRAAGMEAEVVHSGEAALAQDLGRYHLALLDVMLPGINGFELARRLRNDEATRSLPVIFLTARDSEDDTLHGFELGADDYVAKPFSVKQLLARVRAVLARTTPIAERLSHGGLTIDMRRKQASIEGNEVPLTRTEFDLLRLFMAHPGQVFSRQQLLEQVWPSDVIVTERTVDVNVTRLRKKLGTYGDCLATRQGFGYFFKA